VVALSGLKFMFTLQPRVKPRSAFIETTVEIRTMISMLRDDCSAGNVHTSSCPPLVLPSPSSTLQHTSGFHCRRWTPLLTLVPGHSQWKAAEGEAQR
jgi:hypothetical protein